MLQGLSVSDCLGPNNWFLFWRYVRKHLANGLTNVSHSPAVKRGIQQWIHEENGVSDIEGRLKTVITRSCYGQNNVADKIWRVKYNHKQNQVNYSVSWRAIFCNVDHFSRMLHMLCMVGALIFYSVGVLRNLSLWRCLVVLCSMKTLLDSASLSLYQTKYANVVTAKQMAPKRTMQ